MELKHWLIGSQKGQVWKLPAYFDGLEDDAKKLRSVLGGAHDRGWIPSLCTATTKHGFKLLTGTGRTSSFRKASSNPLDQLVRRRDLAGRDTALGFACSTA